MHRTQGIILASEKFGETDQLISIFSKDFGKLKVVAQGSLKPDSKMRSIMQVGHAVDFVILALRSGRYRLTAPSLIETFPRIRNDQIKLTLALFALGLVDRVVYEELRDTELWSFLGSWLSRLEAIDVIARQDGERLAQRFSAKLLMRLGGLDYAELDRIWHRAREGGPANLYAANWEVLRKAYMAVLGFSLPEHFLVQ